MNSRVDEAHEQHENLLLRETVQGALAALPLAQRQAITLAYYGGLTQEEIAVCMGEPVGTVKSRMRRGLMKLRDLLDPMSIDG
jgi:RNA polymerase sigma-70 factor (ECF subfamily)